MSDQALPRRLSLRLPFFYGWVVLAVLCCAGFARQGAAVATLSIFVEPLTRSFGWSRTALSGAVSLGGLLAAIVSPWIGPRLDRYGARIVLCAAVLISGLAALALSLTTSLVMFYLLYCAARMTWAGPFELGIYAALNNWFVARRSFANSIATLVQMAGLVAMPLIAEAAMVRHGWRAGWLAIGVTVLVVGFVPTWLLLVRRPEDLGLRPDGAAPPRAAATAAPAAEEISFDRRQALQSPAFWLLLLYTVLVYPVQAGVSLHQAPHLIERGVAPATAATIISMFSLMSALSTIACGALPARLPVRYPLALTSAFLAAGTLTMLAIHSAAIGFLAGGIFGIGIGGVMTLLPLAWANYFGRTHYGAIRGIALPAQVLAQASGPLLSGILRDATGSYVRSLQCFAVLSALSVAAALLARQPRRNPITQK